jgi:hypothetical protein
MGAFLIGLRRDRLADNLRISAAASSVALSVIGRNPCLVPPSSGAVTDLKLPLDQDAILELDERLLIAVPAASVTNPR